MKKLSRYIILSIIGLASIFVSSCQDFLEEKNYSQLSEQQVLSNAEFAELALQSVYNSFKELVKDARCWCLLVGTDEIQTGALQAKDAARGSWDFCDGTMTVDNGYVRETWEYRWKVIGDAQKIVRALEEMNPTSGSAEEHLIGEAAFLRGFCMYQAALIWGRIPIPDLARIESGELTLARQPLKDVWQFIIDDFTRATKAPGVNDEGRVNSYAGWAMLGKAYMSAPEETGLRDFNKAKECFEKVMDGTYELLPDFADLWDYTKNAEKEVLLTTTFSAARNFANQVQFQIGSRAAQNFFSDACMFAGYDHAVPTKFAYETIENGGIWEEGDTRKEESIRYDFTYNGVTPDLSTLTWEGLSEEDHDELKPHIKKYEDPRTDKNAGMAIDNMWLSGKNIPIVRYADVLLCYAECLNELGNTGDAVTFVNKVRARAFKGNNPTVATWSSMSKEEFRTKLMDERIRELFGENWRRYDLLRTGTFLERIKKYNKWAAKSVANGKFEDYMQLWPIPLTELDLNTDMRTESGDYDQNEGFI